jgi:hypothetical protein
VYYYNNENNGEVLRNDEQEEQDTDALSNEEILNLWMDYGGEG